MDIHQRKYIVFKKKSMFQLGGNKGLKFLSYNVFSGQSEHEAALRSNSTIKLIKEMDPDIICLQEATYDFVYKLKKGLYKVYSKLDVLKDEKERDKIIKTGYIAILFKKKFSVKNKELIYKGGWFDDGILKVTLNTHDLFGFDLSIYNVHLSGGTFNKPVNEILEKRIRRLLELNLLNNDLEKEDHFIVAGDFNSDANSHELFPDEPYSLDKGDDIFPEKFFYPSRKVKDVYDVWMELNNIDPGYTEDYKKNTFRKFLKPKQLRLARFDQVYYKKNGLQADSIKLVGTKPIGKIDNDHDLFPSDHFGLLCTFKMK
jgi:endonuclease/exonuclease/phosphatase family metal-dependent hydrolase